MSWQTTAFPKGVPLVVDATSLHTKCSSKMEIFQYVDNFPIIASGTSWEDTENTLVLQADRSVTSWKFLLT